MMRVAIYARFSTDLQRDRSIDDQVALCRDYAGRNGYDVVAVHTDRARTGAFLEHRTGMKALLAAARTGAFDFMLAESMSRVGRDQEDRAAIRKRLAFAGVQIVTPADGIVAPLVDGIRAVIDSAQLDDMKNAVRRGMRGVVREGRHAGGRPYGYRVVRKLDAGGEVVFGLLEIDEAQAAIVRRIFRDYLAGETARGIAARLNAEQVQPPRGRHWAASTISGHTARGTGILQNPLYRGELRWNRGHTPRDPETHKRVRRAKPEAEWQRTPVAHLRIVSDETFAAAQERRRTRALTPRRLRIKPKRLLSGLLRCGACGGGMAIKDYDDKGRPRLICTQMKEAGRCDHRRSYHLDEIEREVVKGLRAKLGSRALIGHYIRALNEARREASADAVKARTRTESRLAGVMRQIDQTVRALIEERISGAEADRHLPPLRAERVRLEAELAALGAPPKVVTLHPTAVDAYLRNLDQLERLINDDLAAGDAKVAGIVRSMIDSVTIMPTPRGVLPGIKVLGQMEMLLGVSELTPDAARGVVGAGGGI